MYDKHNTLIALVNMLELDQMLVSLNWIIYFKQIPISCFASMILIIICMILDNKSINSIIYQLFNKFSYSIIINTWLSINSSYLSINSIIDQLLFIISINKFNYLSNFIWYLSINSIIYQLLFDIYQSIQ